MTEDRSNRHPPYTFFPLFAVPAIFLLHNLNFYRGLLLYNKVYGLMAAYLLLPLLLFFFLQRILKRPKEIWVFTTTLLLLLFFFFGALQDFLLQYSLTRVLSKTYILPFLFLVPAIYILLKKSEITKLLRSLSIALFFFLLSEFVILFLNLPHWKQTPLLVEKVKLAPPTGKNQQDFLNVHHLIFDGYANSPTLQKVFGYNNPLDSFLLKKGFYVAGKTKSNYNFTPYSLAATLNLHYLRLNEKQLVRDFKNYLLGAEVYQQNEVFQFFHQQQYAVSHFSVLDSYQHLDQLGTFVPKTPFYSLRYQTLERVVMNPWLWQKVAGAPAETIPPSVKESLHYYVHYNREALQHALARNGERQFNFTHFLLPHEPYVFSKDFVDSLQLHHLMDYSNGYIKQVEYANRLIVQLVTELQKNRNNIIILQGDHGFRDYDASYFPPLTQNEALNAFYFPDQDYQLLYDSISPVNTYRIVLNKYFQQHQPLLPDKHFVPVE